MKGDLSELLFRTKDLSISQKISMKRGAVMKPLILLFPHIGNNTFSEEIRNHFINRIFADIRESKNACTCISTHIKILEEDLDMVIFPNCISLIIHDFPRKIFCIWNSIGL